MHLSLLLNEDDLFPEEATGNLVKFLTLVRLSFDSGRFAFPERIGSCTGERKKRGVSAPKVSDVAI